ncbi:hypothetical protein BCY91_01135 [Pelobium manganitolerans]|uniref:DUF4296 domain-containing protein n=1 Tax=Pelobium manganitolerans TaxID=1842495 RepID=A0A419SBQ4_9SPHI|nr:hypothetical protein [Pelobium manganitolerans]RKD20255.1 hypothetical protein BCY91_01135 [Pelobium manganitolerans]
MMRYYLLPFLALAVLSGSCQRSNPNNDPTERKFRFEPIKGIKFYEVRRTFASGLAFNELGFQQTPEWAIRFLSDTTVQAYSPMLNKMLDFELIFSHDGVYNFAREWFRVKEISKDSLLLQRLEVNAKKIAKDVRSEVFMHFYSEDYLKKTGKTLEQLRRPNQQDSAFVKQRIAEANAAIMDSSLFFAARNPVVFETKSDLVKIEKVSTVDKLENRSASYDYLYPEYTVNIAPAYKDFAYTISAVVDQYGKLHVYKFNATDDYRENRRKVLQGILDLYIGRLVKVTPGHTLGMAHSSLVVLNLIGKK